MFNVYADPNFEGTKATVVVAYQDLVINIVNGKINDERNDVYGIIYDVDDVAARGGYEGWLSDRMAKLGVKQGFFKAILAEKFED